MTDLSAAGRPAPKFYRVAWVFYLVLAIAGLVWTGAQRGRLGIDLFVDPGSWWIDLGAGVAIGGALLALWWALRRWFAAARGLEAELARLLAPLAVAEALSLAVISAYRIWTLFALAGGLALGALVALRGPLGGAIVAHLLVNGVNLVRLARRGVPDPDLPLPPPAGPEAPAVHD